MRKVLKKCNKVILIFLIVYSLFGLLMIFSASSVTSVLRYKVHPYYFFVRQAIFLILGLGVGSLILVIPTKNYKYFALFLTVATAILLVGLFSYGKLINNTKSWYEWGHLNFQPSELAKIVLIIFMACFYDELARKRMPNLSFYFIPLAVTLIFSVLTILQPDYGGAFIILTLGFGIFLSVPLINRNFGKVIKLLLIGGIMVGLWFSLSGSKLLNESQQARFTYQKPCSRYTAKTGYQVCNGFIAIHNGGLFGVGLGNSTQKRLYLPDCHTDFIFPIIVEELGLMVGVLVVIGYFWLLIETLKIAKESYNLRNSILGYGAFIYLGLHIIINLAGVLALIPLTGIPLPLLSYGGSYTLSVITILSVILRVSFENNNSKLKAEIKKIKVT